MDAGPLVALVDSSDEHHGRCAAALRVVAEPLGTVWPAVTEALYLLLDVPEGQAAVLEMLRRGMVRLLPLDQEDVPRIQELMAKYRDQPMDLADAALVRVAEREGLDRVFTVDRRDFAVYRIGKRKAFRIIPEAPSRKIMTGPPSPRRPAPSLKRRRGRVSEVRAPGAGRGGGTRATR